MSESPSAMQREEKRKPSLLGKRWFQAEHAEEAAQRGNRLLSAWQTQDERRLWDLGQWAKLYGTAYLGFPGSLASRTISTRKQRGRDPNEATLNGIKSCVDTLASTITQHKPVAQFAPSDGDWTSAKVSELRNRWTAGWFFEQGMYDLLAMQFIDAAVFGNGLLYVGDKRGRAVIRRAFPGDVYIPPGATLTDNRRPREVGWVQLVDRYEAWMEWEGNEGAQRAIEQAPEVKMAVDEYVGETDDLIQINTLWRMPSDDSGESGDGRRLISTLGTETCVIDYREWTHPAAPFSNIRFNPRMWGPWNEGFAELLEGNQLQYNQLDRSICEAQEVAGRIKLFLDDTSTIVEGSITDEIGLTVRGNKPPVSLLWQCVQPEVYEERDRRKQQFYTQSGIAQMAASSEKVSPDESGIAIRERVAIYTERFAPQVQSYQDSVLTLARLGIWTVQDILADRKQASYKVYSTKGPAATALDFADLKFKAQEQYTITCLPVNDLPDTIEGRIALAQDFVVNGYYDEATARQAFQLPDTERIETLYNAQYNVARQTLDDIIEEREKSPVVDVLSDNLPLLLKLAQQHLAYARLRKVAQGPQDVLRKYILAIQAKITVAQAASAPPPVPLGAPKPPPVSGLVPNPNAPPA